MSKKRSNRFIKLARLIKKRRFHIVTAMVAAVALSYFGYYILSSRAASVNDPTKFGINTSGGIWCADDGSCSVTESINRMNDAWNMGARWLRHDYEWSNIMANCNLHTTASCSNPANWNFGGTTRWDEFTKQAHGKGFKIVATLDYIPGWAQGDNVAQHASDYATFAKGFVQHYKSLGYSSNDMVIELGNEEDLLGMWSSTPFKATDLPAVEAQKEMAAYAAIKSVDASFKVISGFAGFACDAEATSTPCSTGGGWDEVAFLKAFYAYIKDPSRNWSTNQMYDYLGVHPYCWGGNSAKPLGVQTGDCPWNEMIGAGSVSASNSILGVMAANGDSKVIWPTEVGYYWLNGSGAANGQQLAATSVTNAYTYMQDSAHASKYGPMFWYSYKNFPDPSAQQYGVYSGNNESVLGTPLPAYYAFKAAAQAASPDTSPPSNVRIVVPPTGTTVSGAAVTFSAGADDDRGVTKVEYYRGSTFLGDATGSNFGWLLTWNSTTVPDGSYAFTVKAYDAAGHVTTSGPITIIVKNQSTVSSGDSGNGVNSSASGGGGSTLVKTVTIGASSGVPTVTGDVDLLPAITNPANVIKVEYYLDGKLIYTSRGGDFGYKLDTTKIKNGHHVVMTKIYNKDGTVIVKSQTISVHNAAGPFDWWWLLLILPIPGFIMITWWRERLGLFGRLPGAIRRHLWPKPRPKRATKKR